MLAVPDGDAMSTISQPTVVRRKFARLSFSDGEVVVSPRDRDIFLISAEKATEACRNAIQLDNRIKRFEAELLTPLNAWCVENAYKVKACYLPVPRQHIQVFVVTNSRKFDFEFAEKVAALELQFATLGWRIGITQLPEAGDNSLATFFDPDGALEVYAVRGSAQE
jgi:hypothetical protein